MYFVKQWDTGSVIGTFTSLDQAKRVADGEGHTGEQVGDRFKPVACVEDELGNLVYNPQFKNTWRR